MNATSPRTGKRFDYASAAGAFLIWGGWAWYVNGPGSAAGLASALAQAVFSGAMTLALVRMITGLRGLFSTGRARFLLPPLISVTASTTLLVFIHWVVSTPRLLATIAPSVSVALIFSFVTSFKLHRLGAAHGQQ